VKTTICIHSSMHVFHACMHAYMHTSARTNASLRCHITQYILFFLHDSVVRVFAESVYHSGARCNVYMCMFVSLCMHACMHEGMYAGMYVYDTAYKQRAVRRI
jgi:hypothetical protein